jgi:hypothetical protein
MSATTLPLARLMRVTVRTSWLATHTDPPNGQALGLAPVLTGRPTSRLVRGRSTSRCRRPRWSPRPLAVATTSGGVTEKPWLLGSHEQLPYARCRLGPHPIAGRCGPPGAGECLPPGPQSGPSVLGARPAGRWAVPGAQARTHPAHRPSKERHSSDRRYPAHPGHPSGSGERPTQPGLSALGREPLGARHPLTRPGASGPGPPTRGVVPDAWRVLIPGNEVRNDPGTGNRKN